MDKGLHEYLELGRQAFEGRDYVSAIKNFELALRGNRNFADVLNLLGVSYYIVGRYDDAVKALKKALEINPRYTEAALNLAVVYNEKGDFDESQKVYALAKYAVKDEETPYMDHHVKGKLANMYAEIGDIYKDFGLYDKAAEEYKKALTLRPEFVDIKTSLGAVYRDMGDFSRSLKELKEAVAMNPAFSRSRIQLGLTYYTMGEDSKAKEEWMEVLRNSPGDRLVRMYMKLLETRRG